MYEFKKIAPATYVIPQGPGMRVPGLIIASEQHRGEIARSERSALCAEAQPYQDLIDRLLYAMAGLNDDEARGLEERLARML